MTNMNKFLIKNLIAIGVAIFFALFASTSQVQALTISVSPTSLINKQLLVGTTSTYNYIFALTDLSEDMNVTITSNIPGLDNWLTVSPGKTFIYKKGQVNQEIALTFAIPAGAVLQKYTGNIEISSGKSVLDTGVANLNSGVNLDVDVELTNLQVKDLKVTAVTVEPGMQDQDLVINTTIYNLGNVSAALNKAVLKISDINGNEISTLAGANFESIEPLTNKLTQVTFKNELDAGQYFADLELFFENKSVYAGKLMFNVERNTSLLPVTGVLSDEMLPYLLGALIIAAIGTIVLVVMILRRKFNRQSVVVAALLIFPLNFLVAFLGYTVGTLLNQTNKNELEQAVSSPDLAVETIVTVEPKLLGANVAQELPESQKPKTDDGKYKIYAEPSMNSEVIDYVEENTKLNRIVDDSDKSADWFNDWLKLSLDEGVGYLPKSSVPGLK